MKKVNPDIDFIRKVKKESGSDLKNCMQCGNCTVVCSLAGENHVFPRKQMIMAGWGMKNELISDPYIWQCHQCGDCSKYCPRDVKPLDVMSSLRSQCIEYFAVPGILVKWMKKPSLTFLTLIIPALIILVVLWANKSFDKMQLPVNYSAFLPHILLNSIFTGFTLISFFLLFLSVKNYTKHFKKEFRVQKNEISSYKLFIETLIDFLKHKNFSNCTTNQYRKTAHLMIFYGFTTLILLTIYAIYAVKIGDYPLNYYHPIKIIGNLGGLSILCGIVILLVKRLNKKDINSSFFDYSFLVSVFLLVITGYVTEILRFSNHISGYHWYFIHLVLMWYVVIFLPYTKFAHFIYRLNAIFLIRKYKIND